MTTQILTGDYGSGYALKAAYSTLIVEGGATISGGGVISNYQYVTVSNAGHVYGALNGAGVALNQGGALTNTGVIEGGAGYSDYSANGGSGVDISVGGSVENSGMITGGAGYGTPVGNYQAGSGGYGVDLFAAASVTNSGAITGGGGSDSGVYAGGGGGGVVVRGGSVTNLGMFVGGNGGDGVNGGAAASGGVGLKLFGGVAINQSGVIEGGVGGGAASAGAYGAGGGAGAQVYYGGALSNAARIQGGAGGYGAGHGGQGGDGVELEEDGTLTNGGTIVSGAGGNGPIPGHESYGVLIYEGGQVVNGGPGAGDAVIEGYYGVRSFGHGAATVTNYGTIEGTRASVALYASYDRLIVEKGAVFEGAIRGGGGTLQLVGGSGTITGLGGDASISGALAMTFSGFGVYALHAGGSWTLAGANALSGGQRLVSDTGVTGTGTLMSDGKIFNTRHGVIDVTGGALTIDETGSRGITNLGLIEATGGSLVIEGPTLGGFGTIAAMGGDVTVQARVIGGGVARVDGGILAFEAKFEQTVAFSGAGGELALADSHDYHGTISGFSGGDSLDLGDIGYVRSGEAKFSGTATGGLLTVRDGTYEARIHLAGDYLGATFTAASDGHGGVVVVDASPLAIPPTAPPSPHAFVAAMAALTPAPAAAGPSPDRARLDALSTLLAPRTQQT